MTWRHLLELGLAAIAIHPLIGAEPGASAVVAGGDIPTAAAIAQLMAETPRVKEAALAPDGKAVAYSIVRGSVAANQFTSELLLQNLDATGKPRGTPTQVTQVTADTSTAFSVKWCPDGRSISYQAHMPMPNARVSPDSSTLATGSRAEQTIVRYDIESQQVAAIPIHTMRVLPQAMPLPPARHRSISQIAPNYTWSPTGRYLAFTGTSTIPVGLDPRGGVIRTSLAAPSGMGLFILDVTTGELTQVAPDRLNVQTFDWSPDERELAISSTTSDKTKSYKSNLSIIDRTTGVMRPLVTRPGIDDRDPRWSRDGASIAFVGTPADLSPSAVWVVSSKGGTPVKLGEQSELRISSGGASWLPDNRTLFYASGYHMAGELVQADVVTGRVFLVTQADDEFTDRAFSFSADRRRVAFIRSSVRRPWDLYIWDLASGTPLPITTFGSSFTAGTLARIERVSWPSRDGRFTIYGLLLTPQAAGRNEGARTISRLPTAVFNFGGPNMVLSGFDSDGYNGSLLSLAARGYAVLVPNTRGRGGYSDAFANAMRDDKSYFRVPHEDMMAGVDMLIERRIADPDRLGIYGHSYGGNLTSFTLTHTNRFKAAVVHEAMTFSWAEKALTMPGEFLEPRVFSYTGVRDPLEKDELDRLIEDSAWYHFGSINTPTLLQFGAHSAADKEGVTLFRVMKRLNVPTEFVVYDAGHVVARPAQMMDELTRLGAWFDFWLRGVPYPDTSRAGEFSAWQASRMSRQRSLQP